MTLAWITIAIGWAGLAYCIYRAFEAPLPFERKMRYWLLETFAWFFGGITLAIGSLWLPDLWL